MRIDVFPVSQTVDRAVVFCSKLKPDARPIDSPDDPTRLVSAADCRLMVFETVAEATRLWIKGRDFTIGRLLGDAYLDEAERYVGGALAIFRLAPQDYHRFHVPVDGVIGRMTDITGEYYTVNVRVVFRHRLLVVLADDMVVSLRQFAVPWTCMGRTRARLYRLRVHNLDAS